ncbi:MAG: proton-conducting transporter membrane subunit [Cytophagales bacterium]|nr:proton-conducting transporter membrane subunit [Cytophagales bacterium]
MLEIVIIYFVLSFIIMCVMVFVRHTLAGYLLYVPFVLLHWYFNYQCFIHEGTLIGQYLRFDKVGLIFMTVISILIVPTVIHTALYSINRRSKKRIIAIHNASMVGLVASMTGVLISEHLGLLWCFLEATTIVASILIYHDRNSHSLEAAWKYFFVSSIGLALAYAGILLLGIAAQETNETGLYITELQKTTPHMSPMWLKSCFLFAIIGISVKLGVVPLFTVDIDAKDIAPSPVGAMLSGGLMNVGFVSIFRFYESFVFTSIKPWMDKILIIIGIASLIFVVIYLFKIKNFKRLLAYSSVEHAAIAIIALSCGHAGYFVAVLHLVFHSLIKSAIFFQIGQLYRVYLTKNLDFTGAYFKLNPAGALVLFLGFVSILGIPPSVLFLTEYYTLKSLFISWHWVVPVGIIVLLVYIFALLSKDFFHILFAPLRSNIPVFEIIKPYESITQYILLCIVFWVGLHPNIELVEYIKMSVAHLPK